MQCEVVECITFDFYLLYLLKAEFSFSQNSWTCCYIDFSYSQAGKVIYADGYETTIPLTPILTLLGTERGFALCKAEVRASFSGSLTHAACIPMSPERNSQAGVNSPVPTGACEGQ